MTYYITAISIECHVSCAPRQGNLQLKHLGQTLIQKRWAIAFKSFLSFKQPSQCSCLHVYNVGLPSLSKRVVRVCCTFLVRTEPLHIRWYRLQNGNYTRRSSLYSVTLLTKQNFDKMYHKSLNRASSFSIVSLLAVSGIQHCVLCSTVSCIVCWCKLRGWAQFLQCTYTQGM